jgi:hypothetical protein
MKYLSIFTNYFKIIFSGLIESNNKMSSTPYQHPEAGSPTTKTYHMFNVGGDTLTPFLPKQLQKQPIESKKIVDNQPTKDENNSNVDFINVLQWMSIHNK